MKTDPDEGKSNAKEPQYHAVQLEAPGEGGDGGTPELDNQAVSVTTWWIILVTIGVFNPWGITGSVHNYVLKYVYNHHNIIIA